MFSLLLHLEKSLNILVCNITTINIFFYLSNHKGRTLFDTKISSKLGDFTVIKQRNRSGQANKAPHCYYSLPADKKSELYLIFNSLFKVEEIKNTQLN